MDWSLPDLKSCSAKGTAVEYWAETHNSQRDKMYKPCWFCLLCYDFNHSFFSLFLFFGAKPSTHKCHQLATTVRLLVCFCVKSHLITRVSVGTTLKVCGPASWLNHLVCAFLQLKYKKCINSVVMSVVSHIFKTVKIWKSSSVHQALALFELISHQSTITMNSRRYSNPADHLNGSCWFPLLLL